MSIEWIGAGLLLICALVWTANRKSKQIGTLQSHNSQLAESREQSRKANEAEIDIDRESDTDLRARLRKDWSA